MNNRFYSARKIRAGLQHFVIGRVLAAVMGFFVTIFVVRLLDINEYAIFVVLLGLQGAATVVTNAGLTQVASKFIPVKIHENSSAGILSATGMIVFFRVLFALFGLLILIFNEVLLVQVFNISNESVFVPFYIFIFGMMVFQFMLSVSQVLLLQRLSKISLFIQMVPRCVFLFVIVLFEIDFGVVGVMWLFALTEIVACVCLVVFVGKNLQSRYYASDSVFDCKALFTKRIGKFALSNYLHSLLVFPSGAHGLRVVGGAFLLSSELAGYGFLLTLCFFLHRFLPANLFYAVIEATIFSQHLEKRDGDMLANQCLSMIKLSWFFIFPLVCIVAFFGGDLIGVLSGGKYMEFQYLFVMLLILICLDIQSVMLKLAVNAIECRSLLVKGGVFSLGIIFFGLFILNHYSYLNAYTLVSVMLLGVLSRNVYLFFMLYLKNIKMIPQRQSILKFGLIIFFSFGLAYVLPTSHSEGGSLYYSIVFSSLVLVFYFFLAFLVKPFSNEERHLINTLLGRKWFVF